LFVSSPGKGPADLTQMKVLPRLTYEVLKDLTRIGEDGSCKPYGIIRLLRPNGVLLCPRFQATALVFLAAAAWARIVPADMRAAATSHYLATLPRAILEGKPCQGAAVDLPSGIIAWCHGFFRPLTTSQLSSISSVGDTALLRRSGIDQSFLWFEWTDSLSR
jgi:hypothetical protein